MARRRKHDEFSVSLFPFLSVLSCVIGTLTLMIAASAIGRVAEDLELEPLDETQSEEPLLEVSDLDPLLARIEAVERVQADIEGIRSQLRAAGIEPGTQSDVLKSVRERAELARLRERLQELERAKVDLEDALKVVSEQTAVRAKRAKSAPINIQPHGEGTGLVPFFVECTRDGLLIHRPGIERSVQLRIDDLAEAARFQAYLRRVRVTRGGSVIFLIRPDGVATYNLALKEVEKLTLRYGKMPLPGDGPLDFSLF